MIYSLRGKVIQLDTKSITLDVNDIGYKIYLTADTINTLHIGLTLTLFTYLAVRENSLDLYGFIEERERFLFELLISISGIGPKGAINILSAINSSSLINAIQTGSTSHLIKISGIGRKTAEKIVLELKDKIGNIVGKDNKIDLHSDADAIEALKMLGYGTEEARESLKKISKDIKDTGDKVKAALKVLN